jgi:lysophospholipase L1-like esterase/pimeloyl-ACP methyl ester carboxylesterase
MKKLFLFVLAAGMLWSCQPEKIRIACVGDSITFGAGIEERETKSYPAQLQEMLGEKYEVGNFGRSGATLLEKGANPYIKTSEYASSKAFLPDIVFIMLGTNDTQKKSRSHLPDFEQDYARLIRSFRELASHPRVILIKPIPAFNYGDTVWISPERITSQIQPLTEKVAFDNRCELIDMYHWFLDKEELLSDKVHPTAEGAKRMAERLRDYLLTDTVAYNIRKRLPLPGETGNFHGFEMKTGQYDSVLYHIVMPRHTAKGKPWVWRARFFGHEPQTDIALLERGYHLVYYDVAGLFGAPPAVARWDRFYAWMQQAGLAKKAALEGMSRGGLIIYNWAYRNPGKVCCIYADAPVLDIRSWPGGKGHGPGSPADWQACLQAYGFAGEEEALKATVNPLDHAAEIAAIGFPMLHIVGDADRVVPVDENTGPFEKIILEHGGNITVIHKAGVGHHPHSLPDPEPIVDFMMNAKNF